MAGATSANKLPLQTPNSSAPIASQEYTLEGELIDGMGKPVTGTLNILASVTQAWRYLFGTFVQRSSSVSQSFSLTAGAAYSQTDMQTLIDQVEALSKVVGSGP